MSDLVSSTETGTGARKPFRPWFGYLCSAAVASLFYMAWTTVFYRLNTTTDKMSVFYHTFNDTIGFVFFQWLVGGFLMSMIFLIIPWIVAVKICRRLRMETLLPYTMIALLLSFPLNLLLSMTPFSIVALPYQPFSSRIILALRYQGLCYLIAGLIFGVIYWFLSVRTTQRLRG